MPRIPPKMPRSSVVQLFESPHRAYVPYYAQGQQNMSRGRSTKKNHSRSRSDGDWNADKAKRQKAMVKRDRTPGSSQGSSSSSHLRKKPKATGGPNSKSSAEKPIRLNNNVLKPNYQWVPKSKLSKLPKAQKSKSSDIPVKSSNILSDPQVMSWESVLTVDSDGKPSVKIDWGKS